MPTAIIPTTPHTQLMVFLRTTKNTIANKRMVETSLNILNLKEDVLMMFF
jgi:hypothetical protein